MTEIEPIPETNDQLRDLLAHLERIQDQFAVIADAITWKRIETAPLDGTPLLLFCPGINSWNRPTGAPDIVVGVWTSEVYSGTGWHSDIGDVDQGYESTGAYFVHEMLRPTHWMPLPSIPTNWTPSPSVPSDVTNNDD